MSIGIMEQMRAAFKAEAMDLLIELDSALLALEEQSGDAALIHRVFRAIHTIKGSGATAGLAHLAGFAHKMEEAFDLAREAKLTVTPELIDCALKACDVIRLILESDQPESEVAGEATVTTGFERLLPHRAGPGAPAAAAPAAAATDGRSAYLIGFKPNLDMFYSGSDPVTLLDDLRELGQAHITAHTDRIPALSAIEAEHCYLRWEILLVTARDQQAIAGVFVFVADECELSICLLKDQASAVALLGAVPEEAFSIFVAECKDHLMSMERDALQLEQEPASRASLDSLFRSVHSIKGNAGLLLAEVEGGGLSRSHPLQQLLRVTHGLEAQFDPLRLPGAPPVPSGMVQLALETCDAIKTLLGRLTHTEPDGLIPRELLQRLGVTDANPTAGQNREGRPAAFLNTTTQCLQMIEGSLKRLEREEEWQPSAIETYLRGLKTMSAAVRYNKCPGMEEPLAQQLRILEAAMRAGANPGPAERSQLADAVRASQTIMREFGARLGPPPEDKAPELHLTPEAGTQKAAAADRAAGAAASSTIRIEQEKLDRLMRVVGELLVARGAFPILAERLHGGADGQSVSKDLREAGANISRIADELQASVMSIRMLPVKTLFQRFPRLVRDLARSLGKEIRLVIEGEGIELDKTILEQIGDPLVHVIRNSVDHGIEPVEERKQKGKDPTGQLRLQARHEAGGVVIEVTDDGRGLNAEALKRKAVEKGILAADAAAAMTDEAAFQLIFQPGLTTAAKVTDVSGRGVGMDVVRSNVRNLQGSIEIRSKPGAGTTLLIRLPTSLMISKGILLEAGEQEYILPLSSIKDMVKVPHAEAHSYRGFALVQVRGEVYPIFMLAEMLGLQPAAMPELSVAIVEAGTEKYGLAVDKFQSEVEVLVKPLTGGLEKCKEYLGAAIMGDGRVVLVLNAIECHRLRRAECE